MATPACSSRCGQITGRILRCAPATFLVATRQRLAALGFGEVLDHKGIGGIADRKRIRCLHTWYAAHLVVPNTIGTMLDGWWREREGVAPDSVDSP